MALRGKLACRLAATVVTAAVRVAAMLVRRDAQRKRHQEAADEHEQAPAKKQRQRVGVSSSPKRAAEEDVERESRVRKARVVLDL